MVLDIHVDRQKIVRLMSGLTPAKMLEVVNHLDTVEMMMALHKMHARKTPANQAHVTNRRENPFFLPRMQPRPRSGVLPKKRPPSRFHARQP